MSVYPAPREILTIYNESDYSYATSTDFTQSDGDSRYLKLTGGILSGQLSTSSIIQNSAGAVATPSYSFTTDTDTGIYNSATNELSIAIGGSQRYVFADSQFDMSNTGGNIQMLFDRTDGVYMAFKSQDTQARITFDGTSGNLLFDRDNAGTNWLSVAGSTGIPTFANSIILPAESTVGNGANEEIAFSDSASSVGIFAGGVEYINVNSSRVLFGTNIFTPSNFTMSNNAGESFNISDSATSVSLTAGGTVRLTVDSTKILSERPIRTSDGSAAGPSYTFGSDTDTGFYWTTANEVNLSCGSSLAMTFKSTGIRLPSGSTDLSYCEESTWSPTIGDGTNNFTTSVANGSYQRINSLIFVTISFTWSSIGSASGAIKISLPFSADSGSINIENVSSVTFAAGDLQIIGSAKAGFVELYFLQSGATRAAVIESDFSASGSIILSGCYLAQ